MCGDLDAVLAGEGGELLVDEVPVGAHPVEFKLEAVHLHSVAKFSRRCSFLRRVLITLTFTTGGHDPPGLPHKLRICP